MTGEPPFPKPGLQVKLMEWLVRKSIDSARFIGASGTVRIIA